MDEALELRPSCTDKITADSTAEIPENFKLEVEGNTQSTIDLTCVSTLDNVGNVSESPAQKHSKLTEGINEDEKIATEKENDSDLSEKVKSSEKVAESRNKELLRTPRRVPLITLSSPKHKKQKTK